MIKLLFAATILFTETPIPEFPAGGFIPAEVSHFYCVEVIEEQHEEPVHSGWIMVGIDRYETWCVPNGGELVVPELPGVKGYSFSGENKVDVLPGTVLPVWDSIWLFPVY